MLTDLSAAADLRGHRIDVGWVWSGLCARPAFRLLRRRRAYPEGPEDGYRVLDLGGLFREPDSPWARIAQVRFLVAGSAAEGGLLQAELTLFHEDPDAPSPAVVEVALHDPAGAPVAARVDEVSRVELTTPDPAPWGLVESLEVFHTPGGAPENSAGVLTVLRDHADGTTPALLRWEPAGEAAVEVEFDAAEVLQTRAEVRTLTGREVIVAWSRALRRDGSTLATALSAPEDAAPEAQEDVALVTLREEFDEDSGDWTRSVHVTDLAAAAEETSYYTLFHRDPADPARWLSERTWRARATATARYGFPDRLYGLLPSVHQYYDEPTPEDRDAGQLRRFLQVFGVALDHLRSSAESLRVRHDLAEVRGDFLPALGGWIGWPTDRTAPLPVQRGEIRMAPAVYGTAGTLPNIVALATRASGWTCDAKEFVHNLFLTNAPEFVPVRELWELRHDGSDFRAPARLSATDAFDGRPAPVAEPGGGTRLLWHSNRSGRWELWTRTLDGADDDSAPLFERADDELPPSHSDLSPAPIRFAGAGGDELWLFWESDRGGSWDVWARVDDGSGWGTPFRITDHRAADRRPAAARGPEDTLWVFWESERRGRPEIWARAYDGSHWSPAVRITEGLGRDHEPAAALDADGLLWLVWRRDEADRSGLYLRVLVGGDWGPVTPLEEPDRPWRDEAPALVVRGGELWLVWHSDRTGRWELWGRVRQAGAWGEPLQLTMRADADKEPAALVDGGDLRIVWRSERPAAEHRSRTVDTRDTALLEQRGLFADRIHYTYDSEREDVDWYARDAVGVYVTPPPGTPDGVVEDVLARARTYLDPFCPATVRLVLIAARAAESSDFFTDAVDVDEPIVDEFSDEIE